MALNKQYTPRTSLFATSDQVAHAVPHGTHFNGIGERSAFLATLSSAAHVRPRAPAQPRARGAGWVEPGGRAPSASRAAAACGAARRLVPRGLGASRPGRWKSGSSASRRQAVDAASADARRSPPSRPSVTCARAAALAGAATQHPRTCCARRTGRRFARARLQGQNFSISPIVVLPAAGPTTTVEAASLVTPFSTSLQQSDYTRASHACAKLRHGCATDNGNEVAARKSIQRPVSGRASRTATLRL